MNKRYTPDRGKDIFVQISTLMFENEHLTHNIHKKHPEDNIGIIFA
jgi:hypothetical protein